MSFLSIFNEMNENILTIILYILSLIGLISILYLILVWILTKISYTLLGMIVKVGAFPYQDKEHKTYWKITSIDHSTYLEIFDNYKKNNKS